MKTPPRETVGPPVSAGHGLDRQEDPGPSFASETAKEEWVAAGKPALGKPSGKHGHTAADVRAAIRGG